jgi:hypothetical protein
MRRTFKVKWEVEDGYVGKARPQTSEMDEDDFDGCETRVDVERVILDFVQEDFNQQISWSVTGLDDLIDDVLNQIKGEPA